MRQSQALVLILLGAVTALAACCIFSAQFSYGPVLVSIGDSHGVHLHDLPTAGLWVISMLAGWSLLATCDS